MRLVTILVASCLPALPAFATQELSCAIERFCTGPAAGISCMELGAPAETLRLVIPATGSGTINTGREQAELLIDRRQSGMLDMSYVNTPDGFRVVLHFLPETGRLAVAQLVDGKFELAELACTEAG